MNKWILFLIIFLSSCSEYQGDKSSNNYDSVEIEFVGNSDEFYAKERLVLEITDSSIVSELNNLKNNSKSIWFGGFKATDYIISLIFKDTETNQKLLIRILKSTDWEPFLEYGPGTMFDTPFKNEQFVDYVTELIKLNKIKNNKGELTQEQYNKFFFNDR